jgi:A/G-specific adenine glycosylase
MKASYDPQEVLKGFPVKTLRNDLLSWWSRSKRSFPWRETRDSYRVLVAEILLHRTKAEQVIPLYELFLKRFPNVQVLARGTPEDIQELLHSAGLHWRWKLVHLMAVEIQTRFNGQIPDRFEDLISLPGVSHYIATAVRCFAFGQPEAVLDTNTVRATGRILSLMVNDSSRRSKLFRSILQTLLDCEHAREFNFALIDFAAVICRARSPRHTECPFRSYCRFYLRCVGH